MKSNIFLAIIVIFLFFSLLPILLLAQARNINECCKISSKFSLEIAGQERDFGPGCVMGAPGGYCRIGDNTYTFNDSSLFEASDTGASKNCINASSDTTEKSHESWGIVCLISTIYNVTNWLFYLMTVVAVLLFIIGGVFYMASAGEPEKAKKGKTIIIYAIIGLVIALIAKMIPSLIKTVLK